MNLFKAARAQGVLGHCSQAQGVILQGALCRDRTWTRSLWIPSSSGDS